jgi:hypothetical protein
MLPTDDVVYCEQCDGTCNYMGTLGCYDWFRCEMCGWEQHIEWEREEDNE